MRTRGARRSRVIRARSPPATQGLHQGPPRSPTYRRLPAARNSRGAASAGTHQRDADVSPRSQNLARTASSAGSSAARAASSSSSAGEMPDDVLLLSQSKALTRAWISPPITEPWTLPSSMAPVKFQYLSAGWTAVVVIVCRRIRWSDPIPPVMAAVSIPPTAPPPGGPPARVVPVEHDQDGAGETGTRSTAWSSPPSRVDAQPLSAPAVRPETK